MNINYELYKAFYYVATTLSFSEAAEKLYISQSAVSQAIKTLERKLEQSLFVRTTKKVRLTQEGEILLRHIEPAINLFIRAEMSIKEASTTGGQIKIGASDTICRYFLVPYLEKFHKEFPNVHINIINATSIGCTELLETRKVDVIIVNLPNKYIGKKYTVNEIHKFKDIFVVNDNFEELCNKKITLKELAKYPILMLEQKSTTSEFLHSMFQKENIDFIPEIELTSNDLLKDLAKIGLGIACVPDYCLTDTDMQTLFTVETEELPERKIGIVYDERFISSGKTKEFLNLFDL